MAGEIMVVATVVKNTIGFSMSYWVASLGARRGLVAPAMVEFALTLGPMLLGAPLYFWGKRLRRFTRNSAFHQWSEMYVLLNWDREYESISLYTQSLLYA